MKKRKKKVFIITSTILIVALAVCCIYLSGSYKPDNQALECLKGGSGYTAEYTSLGVEFYPSEASSTIGLIIYPGGKVEYTAYSPIASRIAQGGYFTAIAKMPYNLAIFKSNAADGIIEEHPEIDTWIICGHSLGGVMASSYALKNTDKIKGIIFWAAYPKANMSSTDLKGLCLHGSLDGLVSEEKLQETKVLFPKNTKFVEIKGGNHCSFGSYGFQKGDNPSEITSDQQKDTAVEEMLEFMEAFNNN